MLFLITSTMYRCIIIAFGVLYPAFNSYKSLNRRDGYEQVKWMMYWIVFAAFMACEVVTDLFFSWLPLYNEAKILFVLWMVLPMTRGSSYLYRKIIHPNLLKHETRIDGYIAQASSKGCEVILEFGQHGMNIAANAVLKTAVHLKRSYSVGDISKPNNAMGQPNCMPYTGILNNFHGVENSYSQSNLTQINTFTHGSMDIPITEEEADLGQGLKKPKTKRTTTTGTTKKPSNPSTSILTLDPIQRRPRPKKTLHKVHKDI